jgi:hypothetical protein
MATFLNMNNRDVPLCEAGHEEPFQSELQSQITQRDGSRTVPTRVRRSVSALYGLDNLLVILIASSSYGRIIHRVFMEAEPSDREDAAKLLGWLVCARRPLKWHEIQGAWSFDSDTQTFDYEEMRLRVDSKELCGSLVEIRSGGVIDLVHLTAKLYVHHPALSMMPF